MNTFSRKTFDDADTNTKLAMLFDNDVEIYAMLRDIRDKKLMFDVKKSGFSVIASGVCSFLGGVTAVWAYMKFLTP